MEVIQAVKESIEQSPKRSLRKRCQSLDLSYSTTQMICRDDLNMAQRLTAADREKIMIMAVKIQAQHEENQYFLNWPPKPALSPPDFFLWGYLKSKVYVKKRKSTTELKEYIREEIRAIPRSMCKSVMQNFIKRMKKSLELNGGHME